MSLQVIEKAFRTRLAAYGLPVAYQNVEYVRTSDTFLELFILPGQTTSQYLSQDDRSYIGIAQININVPLNIGTGSAYSHAQSIAALYNIYISQDTLRIFTQPMYELPAQKNETHFILPIRIPYRCEVA